MPDNERRRPTEPTLGPKTAHREHFVPRGYLRFFAGDDGLIRPYDLEAARVLKRRSTKSVAFELGFYDLEVGPGEVLSAEGWLEAAIETPALAVFQRLVSTPEDFVNLSLSEQNAVARYLGASMFRGPEFRRETDETFAEVVAFAKNLARGYARNTMAPEEAEASIARWEAEPDHRWLGNDQQPQPAELTVYMLESVQGWANLFLTMDWRLKSAREPSGGLLYTSDHPVSRRLPPVRPDFHWGALTDWHYQLPLSETTLLKLAPWTDPRKEPLGKRIVGSLTSYEVTMANALTTAEATRYAYGEGEVMSRADATAKLAHADKVAIRSAAAFGWRPGEMFQPPGTPPSHWRYKLEHDKPPQESLR